MRIDIYSDTICPWCYIGKRRLARALEARPQEALELRWRAFQLNPEMPDEGMDRRTYLELKFGGPDNAKQVYDRVSEAGRSEDIPFAFDRIRRTPNTVDSHRLVRFASDRGQADAVVERLFEAYFLEGADVGDLGTLVEIAVAAGLDAAEAKAFLDSDLEVQAVRAEDARARQIGIQGVPTFILNDKYVLSGAHPPEVLFQLFDLAKQDDAERQTG